MSSPRTMEWFLPLIAAGLLLFGLARWLDLGPPRLPPPRDPWVAHRAKDGSFTCELPAPVEETRVQEGFISVAWLNEGQPDETSFLVSRREGWPAPDGAPPADRIASALAEIQQEDKVSSCQDVVYEGLYGVDLVLETGEGINYQRVLLTDGGCYVLNVCFRRGNGRGPEYARRAFESFVPSTPRS